MIGTTSSPSCPGRALPRLLVFLVVALALLAWMFRPNPEGARLAREMVDRVYASSRDSGYERESPLLRTDTEKYGPITSYRIVRPRSEPFTFFGARDNFAFEVESTRQRARLREVVHVVAFYRTRGYRYKMIRERLGDGEWITSIRAIDLVSATPP